MNLVNGVDGGNDETDDDALVAVAVVVVVDVVEGCKQNESAKKINLMLLPPNVSSFFASMKNISILIFHSYHSCP